MEHLAKAISQIRTRVWLVAILFQSLSAISTWAIHLYLNTNTAITATIFLVLTVVGSLVVGWIASRFSAEPLEAFGNAIIHVSPSQNAPAPKTDDLQIGREYVSSLIYQLYQVASMQDNKILAEHKREATQASNILTHLPLPLLVFNKQQLITFGTNAALDYCGVKSEELFGKQLYDALDLEFPSEFTLENWVNDCQQNKVTDTAYWRQVRLNLKTEKTTRQFDMSGYYNRDNPTGIDFIITMFDRTKEYQMHDDSIGFMAMAVHELRTPLTIMRGYLEVFEDELADKLDPEMTRFMQKMLGASEQLTAFVNNILNVARIQENQLTVKVAEENWGEMVKHAGTDMDMRATALDKILKFDVPEDLPTVAVDRVTIYEVLCNLLDNAIKYSGDSKTIELKSYLNENGMVETVVIDHGVGIPTNVIPNLFEKFHRNHRNSAQISGTGLGLYLSKAIVKAHGGDIWVKSKVGEGTTVGFTVKPYSKQDPNHKGDNNEIVRTARGWIKNHSLYRS